MLLIEGRSPVPDLVALRWFDLDDLSAIIAKELGAVGAAQDPGQINDYQIAKRRRRYVHHAVFHDSITSEDHHRFRSCLSKTSIA